MNNTQVRLLVVSQAESPSLIRCFKIHLELIFGPQAGVIAQEVQRIIPDAVSSAGPFTLSDGREINDMLIVNKERIFLGKPSKQAVSCSKAKFNPQYLFQRMLVQ